MPATRILIIEDDMTLSEQTAQLLQDKGYYTAQCLDGIEGLNKAIKEHFDLILLDALLPSLDGFSLLNKLRKTKQTPVMMVTACGAEQERIEGYRKGADDYLPKPFSFTEMLLRIEALLRRSMGMTETVNNQNVVSVDQLTLNRTHQTVHFDGVNLEFTPIQFRLLWVMIENQHDTLSKPLLYQTVLARSYSRFDRSLDMHMSRIRKKLVDVGMPAERLATIHGKGYRFT